MTDELTDKIIYWAIAHDEAAGDPAVIATGTPGWPRELRRIGTDKSIERVVVVVEHLISRLLVDLLRRRRPQRFAPFAFGRARRQLRDDGWQLESSYLIWPSAQQPRIAIPRSGFRIGAWMQRSGVLGGGKSVLTRALLRSWAATPLVPATARASVIVATRRPGVS